MLFGLGVRLAAQDRVFDGGVVTFPALTNTFAVVTGRCELRLTAGVQPLPGSTVSLDSPDAYLVFTAIRPSVVAASYLGQVRIQRLPAVHGNNCRVVAYGDGTVIVPHGSAFRPLEIFEGPHFTGASTSLLSYVYYRGNALGAFQAGVRSFRLRRGYAVTLAEWEDGTGYSRHYVAADGEVEMGVLPAELSGRVRFVYVVPWRWSSKKGIAGDIEAGLNVGWKYNWNLNQSSTADVEYVPIRQNRWWPGLNQDWRARGSVHLLGFNEPDRPDQANLSVADALSAWPELLATGLRVGSPAPSDGGRNGWLYPFIQQADAAGLRVDFVAVHYYWCFNPADPAGAASQFYNFLKATYDQVKRPIWITEWNNGANWTGCADPTFAQQQACIAAMIQMLEETPWVERYALYNWVEDVRRVKWDDGSLTPAGVVYRDQPSRIGYLQTGFDPGTRGMGQYSFDGHVRDESGHGHHGVTSGSPVFTNGVRGQALVFDGVQTRVSLPPGIARGNGFTFAAWVYWRGGGNWQRIFDFGNSTTEYMFLTPRSSAGTLRFGLRNGGSEQIVETAQLPINRWTHVAVTLSASGAQLYVNGVRVAAAATSITPAQFRPRYNFLGRSQWPADPHFAGMLDEVLITDYVMTSDQIARLLTNQPPQFTNRVFDLGTAVAGEPFSATLAGTAFDPDPGDTLVGFRKAAGPDWVQVSLEGGISGVPDAAAAGPQYVTVRVTDAAGQNDYAVAVVRVRPTRGSGRWAADADGFWSDPARWEGGWIASGAGQTADFASLNIGAARTVWLDTNQTIGVLRFGDQAGAQGWTLAGTNDAVLTLDSGTNEPPRIFVTNFVTLAVPLSGTNGWAKSGPGVLVLAGENSVTGTAFLDSGGAAGSDGIVRAVHPRALATLQRLSLRNNNSGVSTLELDGSQGGVSVVGALVIHCRNHGTAAVRNLAGTNTLGGPVYVDVGGDRVVFESSSGQLRMLGPVQYTGALTGGRSVVFTGAGDHWVTGSIRASTNGAPIGLIKNGTGTLVLGGLHTYTNATQLQGGTLWVTGVLGPGPVTVGAGTVLGGTGTIPGTVRVQAGGVCSPGLDGAGRLTVVQALEFQPGSHLRIGLDPLHRTQAVLAVVGGLTGTAHLTFTNVSGEPGAFRAGEVYAWLEHGEPAVQWASVTLPALPPGLDWNTNLLSQGRLAVVRAQVEERPRLAFQWEPAGGSGRLTWPSAYRGWLLETNATDLTDPSAWFPVPESAFTNSWVWPAGSGPVFYRLRAP
ncbi:glycosyl hydrolase [Limisphaera sp. 4302-co]|uniref:glycosyl hydrolase n=1 Tax=Limisphaera sp. 4302-co TaxID=3400417 RepID=UPI003C17F41C